MQSQSIIAICLAVCLAIAATAAADAAEKRPFRGAVKMSVLLCKYNGAPTPGRNRALYEDLLIDSGTGGHADYWSDVSGGSITMNGSTVRGWYTLDQTEAEARAYGGGGSANRIKKHTDCVDKAREQGYTPPSDHLVVVITSPRIDTFGFDGGAFVGEDASVGVIAHEVGHGLGLEHSYSDDTGFCSIDWASVAEYDDQWDVMSYANVFSRDLGVFGRGGPGLNAYHLDRTGWLPRNAILRFGANGDFDQTVTLRAPTRGGGIQLIRIPFDPTDLYRYYTVEYRVGEDWDSGIGTDRVLIHEVVKKNFTKCSDGSSRPGAYRSYLLRDPGSPGRPPLESVIRNGVRVETLSKDAATGQATVRIRSTRPDLCITGLVWRQARWTDHVCVTPARRTAVREENRLGPSRRQPGGGAYGPDTCRQGFVWREAFSGDRVCVTPASRDLVRLENRGAWARRIGAAAYGPNTCREGFVWREADNRDWVCVTPARRAEVREENQLGPSRRQPGGGAYGPDTCRSGFVWREAFPGDRVCVPPARRSQAAQENDTAHDRLANKGA